MSKSSNQEGAAKSAQNYFRKSEQADVTAKQLRKKERQAESAKTANLRRLRLEKEAADKKNVELAVQTGAESAAAKPIRSAPRKRSITRLVY